MVAPLSRRRHHAIAHPFAEDRLILHQHHSACIFLPIATPKNILEMLLNALSQTLGGSFRGRQCRSDTSSDSTSTSTEPSVHRMIIMIEKKPSHGKCLKKPGCQSSLDDASSASLREGGTSWISSVRTVFSMSISRLFPWSVRHLVSKQVGVCSSSDLSRR